jgi:hypothetical protein
MADGVLLNVNGARPAVKGPAAFRFSLSPMAAQLKKGQLPTKICVTCGLPFEYRKKWRNNWPEVKYCSEKCQRNKPAGPPAT